MSFVPHVMIRKDVEQLLGWLLSGFVMLFLVLVNQTAAQLMLQLQYFVTLKLCWPPIVAVPTSLTHGIFVLFRQLQLITLNSPTPQSPKVPAGRVSVPCLHHLVEIVIFKSLRYYSSVTQKLADSHLLYSHRMRQRLQIIKGELKLIQKSLFSFI